MNEKEALSVDHGDPPTDTRSEGVDRRGRAERRALGQALEARSEYILDICQRKYVDQSEGLSLEVVASDPMWNITSVAVTAIANWLETGEVAGDRERDQIASLGHAAAKQEARMPAEAVTKGGSVTGRRSNQVGPSGTLSVTLMTKLNLWWKDATCRVLNEEATRLGISSVILHTAIDMVDASCNSSMVRMAKRYDRELQELHDQLAHLALHDPLTGLANRAVLFTQLDRAISRLARHSGGLAVAFIDLDNFKTVNDLFGHGWGDELLTAMAARFASRIRPGDTIARFGGDEFVALFEDLTAPVADATALAERLHHASAQPVEVAGEQVYTTASIGVAVVTGPDYRSEAVIARADSTMYAVKRAGRDHVAVVEVERPPGEVMEASRFELLLPGAERERRQQVGSID